MKIVVCNGKGGAGKTTMTVLIAAAFRSLGYSTAVLDRDPQGTATRWINETRDSELAQNDGDYRVLLIDTPPRLDSDLLHQSLAEADCAILVSSPSPADLWTSQDTVAVIKRHLPAQRPALILYNQVQQRTVLARDLDALAERIGLRALDTHVCRRQSFQHAAILGWRALDRDGREELTQVALELARLNS